EHTVTSGIISALHRPVQISETQHYPDLIQTDASINPGNSGGPLLNIDGEMIGLNVAVRVGAQGIGFAIPVNDAMNVASRLLSVERISHLSHGVLLKTVEEGGAMHVEVLGTREGSAGEAAGLERGDIVRRVGDREIHRKLDFELALLGRRAEEEVELEIERDGTRKVVSLVLQGSRRSSLPAVDSAWRDLGIQVEPVSRRVIRQMQGNYNGGLRVLRVRPGSPADREGVRRGDILVGMHQWETATLDNLEFVLNSDEVRGRPRIKFFILRNGRTLYGWLDFSR
ncbi:MAG TPA: PDZ domain-containing protein, partial [Planctomycetaceae bacterium]|nr:PDZ domain-containing protein [Planctomycetaceae bacterium]